MKGASLAETRAVYARWAPTYPPVPHNPLMALEQSALLDLWPAVAGCRVLDLACGSGRYARLALERGASEVLALDACLPMLARLEGAARICASMTQLPLPDAQFDLVVCGLAIAHADDLLGCLQEVARVLRPGGALVYSDFHPAAARQALRRGFRDTDGQSWNVPHAIYEVHEQVTAATRAGLRAEVLRELRVGHEFTAAHGGDADFHARWPGLPLVLLARFAK